MQLQFILSTVTLCIDRLYILYTHIYMLVADTLCYFNVLPAVAIIVQEPMSMSCLCRIFLDNQFYTAFSILLNQLLLLTPFYVGACWFVPCVVIPSFCCTYVVYLCYLACSCQPVICEAISVCLCFTISLFLSQWYTPSPHHHPHYLSTTTVAYLCSQ